MPNTLIEKLTNIKTAKENLKTALEGMGLNPGNDFGSYANLAQEQLQPVGSGVKLFSTIEDMNVDPNPHEGDIAVIYRSEIQNAKVDSKFQIATFPDKVVLDTAITDYVDIRYRAVDSSKMFDCWGSLDSSRFMMNCHTDNGSIRIQYTSSDGITYTRTDTTGNPVDFGTEIYYEMAEYWNDAIGKFIQIGGNVFEGLFEYSFYKDKTKIKLPLMSGLNIQYNSSSNTISSVTFNKEFSNEINFTKLVSVYNKFISDTSTPNNAYIYLDNNDNLKFVQMSHMLCYDKNVNFLGASVTISTDTDTTAKIYNVDLENETYTLDTELEPSGYIYYSSSYNWNYYNLDNKTIPFNIVNSRPTNFNNICIGDTASSKTSYTKYIEGDDCYVDTSSYLLASTQLSATPDCVYEKEFYGKNGIEIGTLGAPDNSFADINAEIYNRIQNKYETMEPRILTDDDKTIDKNIYFIPTKNDGTPLLDTSHVTNMMSMFYNCDNLVNIPQLNTDNVTNMFNVFENCNNLKEVAQLNTNKVTNMQYMFRFCINLVIAPQINTCNVTDIDFMFGNCTNLVTVPLLDISKVTSIENMFCYCPNLSDESLNNILAMCTNATAYKAQGTNMRLNYIGLTSEQATRCQSLSNYQAFLDAGWTTGY